MINFSNILSSIGVVAGNLNADNKYDFYYGIEWSDGSFTYNEYEFYEKSGFDSQYDFFQNYADSQYDFYRDIDSPGVIDQYSFFKNGGQFFNLSPVASFTTSSYNKVDDTFSFTNTSVNADTYSWDFGDGNTSTQTNPTHTYVTAGDYTVELTASEGGLNPSTHTLVVKVYDYNVEFTSVNNQLEVTFTNTTTATNITIDQYDWDFGDGNTSTDTNPTHTYAVDGTYTVNLMTYFSIDGDTISDGVSHDVTVSIATFVEATGGTVTTITDGGVNYKVHTFTSGGTFNVTSGGDIEYLVVGRGAGGGNGTGNSSSGSGGSGGQVLSLNEGISVSSYTISIGSTTSFNGQSLGTGGGVGGGSPVSGSSHGNGGSNGTTSDINGSSYTYGSSGGSGASQVFAGNGTTYYGGGGGSGAGNGAPVYRNDGSCEIGGSANGYGGGGGGGSAGRAASCNGPGGSGNNGVVIIRYETA